MWTLFLYFFANCNIKLSTSSARINQLTAGCGPGEEEAVGDRRGQAGRRSGGVNLVRIGIGKTAGIAVRVISK